MRDARRTALPHDVPSWVDPEKEVYFVTIICRERVRNQLATPEIAERLFETVRHRQEQLIWWPHLFLLMPDHVHALLSFPPSGKAMQLVISKWKEWTAKQLGIVWQRDFFEHRLRHEESWSEKADYIYRIRYESSWSRALRIGHSFILRRAGGLSFSSREF